MIDIVMVTFNRVDYSLDTIRYLEERTQIPYRLIIVDNGSTDETPITLPVLADEYIQLDSNYGLQYAKNIGLAKVRSEPYFVSTDNDILCPELDPDWLAQEIALMDAHPDYAAIALRPQVFVGGLPGTPFEQVVGDIRECSHVGGVLRIMRTKAVRQVGGWRNLPMPGRGHEEIDICGKLRQQDWKVGYAKNLFAWHAFGENWGYGDIPVEVHQHNPITPPPEYYDNIRCDPKTWRPL